MDPIPFLVKHKIRGFGKLQPKPLPKFTGKIRSGKGFEMLKKIGNFFFNSEHFGPSRTKTIFLSSQSILLSQMEIIFLFPPQTEKKYFKKWQTFFS